MLSDLGSYIGIILPLIFIEIIMKIIAIVDVLKKDREVRWSKTGWIISIIIFTLIGWLLYFLFGRKEK